TTTSLESSTVSYIDGLGEGFRIALPHRELTAIINRAKSESVRFELVGDLRVKIDAGRAISELSGSDPDTFPTVHAGDTSNAFNIDAKDLLAGLEYISYAMSKDVARPSLNGMFLQQDGGKLTAVATDGHRLVVHDFGEVAAELDELKKGVILGREGVLSLQNVLKSHDGNVMISVGRTVSA